jgi:hypothetical protein
VARTLDNKTLRARGQEGGRIFGILASKFKSMLRDKTKVLQMPVCLWLNFSSQNIYYIYIDCSNPISTISN